VTGSFDSDERRTRVTDGGPPPDDSDAGSSSDDSQSTLPGILVFLAIGGALVYGGAHLQGQMPSAEATEPVEATVVESDFTQRGSGPDREFTVSVTYEYDVDGQTYRSSNVKAGAEGYTVDTRKRARTLLDEQWAEGNTIEAEVDPDDPQTAYLVGYRRGDRLERTLIHYGLMGVGGLMILASVVSLTKKVGGRL